MNKFRQYFQNIKQNWVKNKLLLWGLGLVGALLLILPFNCQGGGQETPVAKPAPIKDGAQELQQELESILGRIEGAGRVKVMLTMEDEAEYVYARNEESSQRTTSEEDSQGGLRQQFEYDSSGQLVLVQAGNQQTPVAVKVIKPRVRGVLVVAAGADNPLVRERLIRAVQGALGLPAYKISVQKGQ